MGKNIILKQLNKSSTYDELYPRSAVDYLMLSENTSAAYGLENGNAKDAIDGLYSYIYASDVVIVKVVDEDNNPLPNITVNGIANNPVTGADGIVKGVANGNSITLTSIYVDTVKSKTVDITKYKNTTKTCVVIMNSLADGSIVRYSSSQNVMFSNKVASIDVCCVGGGGGGNTYHGGPSAHGPVSAGGGGGGIVNAFSVDFVAATKYRLSVGAGGNYSDSATGGAGGSSSFLQIVANGGGGAYRDVQTQALVGGSAGLTGCGDGGGRLSTNGQGGSNTTISEFNDGAVFYSGGGGGGVYGREGESNPLNGGSPNGANGAWKSAKTSAQSYSDAATTAGIGGGGGGGIHDITLIAELSASSGGSGLVAIKIHLKS